MTISTILVAAIYRSSASMVSAIGVRYPVCHIDEGGNSGICCWAGEPPACYNCVVWENGKWDCVKIVTSSPPPALKDALAKAHAGAVGVGATTCENNTSVKNGEQLKSGGCLKGGY